MEARRYVVVGAVTYARGFKVPSQHARDVAVVTTIVCVLLFRPLTQKTSRRRRLFKNAGYADAEDARETTAARESTDAVCVRQVMCIARVRKAQLKRIDPETR